jgi:putative redox protein
VTTVRHLGRVVASTSTNAPAYRVDIQAGAHQLVVDEPVADGGGYIGPNPFEFLLSGLVGCTAITLRMYAERKGWELTALEVDARFDRDDDGHGSIQRTITVPVDLPSDQRNRLAEIAERTPVTLAIQNGTPIITTFVPGVEDLPVTDSA